MPLEVRSLSASECVDQHDSLCRALATILKDCVDGGASVSFMAPFPLAEAVSFFDLALREAASGMRTIVVAAEGDEILGTVQVVAAAPPNQPHRADIAKLLVKRSARGRGIAALLMTEAERCAKAAGKSLLVLDTVTGSTAERLYGRLGWNRLGVIPNYALFPDGRFCDTTVFWKSI